jgi:hypothetical protein
MNTITKKELLDFCLKDAQQIARIQHLDIDTDYNLIEFGLGFKDGKYIRKPKIEINDLENMVVIYIKYQKLPVPEHINITELKMSKPKCIFRNKELFKFDKVID